MTHYKPTPDGFLKKTGEDSVPIKLRRRTEGFWILPTISRPKNMGRLIESYKAVAEDAPVVVFLWRDDPHLEEYLNLSLDKDPNRRWPNGWTILIEKERFTAADAMRLAVKYAPRAAFYGFLADDVVFKTPWSRQLASAATPCFVSYPDDCIQGEGLCTHFACGGDLVRQLGWWALPGLKHHGIDLVFMNLGYNVPGLLKYRPDVIFEHMHPMVDKGKWDDIYNFAESILGEDNKVYQHWLRADLPSDIHKVRGLLYG